MRHYIFVMILMLLGVATTSYAQRTRKVHGEYIYHAPENVSLEQAKKTALSRAQIQALGDEFGTVVAQHNATLMNNTNGSTQTDFTSLSSSDVKGEWLETIGEPKYEISYEQGMLVVKCSVSGKARELVATQNSFAAKILRNGQKGTYQEQIKNVTETCDSLLNLLKQDYNIVIGHGNGPQVGNVMLQHEAGKKKFDVEAMPMDFCVAETQGSIGYLIELILE